MALWCRLVLLLSILPPFVCAATGRAGVRPHFAHRWHSAASAAAYTPAARCGGGGVTTLSISPSSRLSDCERRFFDWPDCSVLSSVGAPIKRCYAVHVSCQVTLEHVFHCCLLLKRWFWDNADNRPFGSHKEGSSLGWGALRLNAARNKSDPWHSRVTGLTV